MAREQGARSVPRRSNSGLDPSGSSIRVSTRRSSAPRAPSGPRRDAPSPRRDGPNVPRNRRLPRAKEPGPSFGVRAWAFVFSQTRRAQALLGAGNEKFQQRFGHLGASTSAIARGLVVLGFIFGLGYYLVHHLTTAPAFALDVVDIKGAQRLGRDELLKTAGLQIGQNVFAESIDDVRERLVRHPWVASAEVSRSLPSRFTLTIVEREPAAMMAVSACATPSVRGADDEPGCEEQSAMYLVSADGKLFRHAGYKGPIDLPVITGLTLARYTKDPELSRRMVVDALALLAEYRSSGLWQRLPVGEIHIEVDDELSLYVGDDLTSMTYVRLGVPPYAQKLRRMKKVLDRLDREHARAEYIYLDNKQHPDRVAVRVR